MMCFSSSSWTIIDILLRAEENGSFLRIVGYFYFISSYGQPNWSNAFRIAISVTDPFSSGLKSAEVFTAQAIKNIS
jgi:hypothetical protein